MKPKAELILQISIAVYYDTRNVRRWSVVVRPTRNKFAHISRSRGTLNTFLINVKLVSQAADGLFTVFVGKK